MRFEEFRALIEERKKLTSGLIGEITFLRIKEIDKKLCYEEWLEFKDVTNIKLYLDLMKSKIYLLFEVGYENVGRVLKKFFKDEAKIVINKYHYREGQPVYMGLIIYKRCYNLGFYNDILYCLCTDGKEDWEILLRDYPDLREFLWQEFKALKNAKKTDQISLIKKMVEERNQEQDFLTSPEKTAARIREILQEKEELNTQLSSLKDSLEEIEV